MKSSKAVRPTVIAAQVLGTAVQLGVKVGDRVSAGQVFRSLQAGLRERA